MDDYVTVILCETVILHLLPLRTNYNSLVFFFELMVAKCLSVSIFYSSDMSDFQYIFLVGFISYIISSKAPRLPAGYHNGCY